MKISDKKNRLKQQNGSIMVTALMIMSILSIVGIHANNVATTELQVTTNVQTNQMAFYNADAGVQHTLAVIREQLNNSIATSNIDLTDSDFQAPNNFSFIVENPDGTWSGPGPYRFLSTGTGPGNANFTIEVMFNITPQNIPAFNFGILAEGNVNINGAPNITGNIHANGNINQNGSGTITGCVSAHGSTSVGSAVSGTVTPNAQTIDVPQITDGVTYDEYDLNYWRDMAQNLPNEYHNTSTHSFNPADDADLSHKIVFVEGNITVGGNNFRNVTLIATGNITINGSSAMNPDGSIGTAMIAGGNITFNGASSCYGAFWSNGNAVWNGTGTVHGAIVSNGDITRNGVLNFTHNSNFSNDNLPKVFMVSMSGWADQGLL